MPEIAPHMQRVLQEKAELDKKGQKLLAFLKSPTFGTLPRREQRLLDMQKDAMATYSAILHERIEMFAKALGLEIVTEWSHPDLDSKLILPGDPDETHADAVQYAGNDTLLTSNS